MEELACPVTCAGATMLPCYHADATLLPLQALEELACPVTWIYGVNDWMTPSNGQQCAERRVAAGKRAECVLLDGAGQCHPPYPLRPLSTTGNKNGACVHFCTCLRAPGTGCT